MSIQSFKTTKVPKLGLALENLKKKCHLDVVPVKSFRIYYREQSGASSQRLWAV
jgi:hypothetical protein